MSSFPFVRITKLRAAPNPTAQPGDWDTFVQGVRSITHSLPVDYEMQGFLVEPPEVGGIVRLLRIQRNDVAALGVFQSTPITAVGEGIFTTKNSVYQIQRIPDQMANLSNLTHYACEGGQVVHGTLPDGSLLALALKPGGAVDVVMHEAVS
jgi:hypothetical protein